MSKYMLRTALLFLMSAAVVITSLSAYTPKELFKDQVAVLMYHHVHDTDKSSNTITTKMFRDQLAYLKSKGYHFINMEQFKRFLGGSPVPDNAALVTFDDGYESFYLNVYPILKEMNVPAVNFIITDTLEHPDKGNIPFLSREELREMAKRRDLVAIGCHTDALHAKADGKALLTTKLSNNGKTESDAEYNKRIVSDTRACIDKINDTFPGNADTMAYPFGIFNEAAVKAVQEGGIRYAFTILPRMVTRDTDPMRIPRINAGDPYFNPETLHNMIMRRISAVKHPHAPVPLRETVEQIGGYLLKDKADGRIVIHYNGRQFKVNGTLDEITRQDTGQAVPLKHGMKIIGARSYIDADDLQAALETPIYFDAATRTFTTKPPSRTDTDNESLNLTTKG